MNNLVLQKEINTHYLNPYSVQKPPSKAQNNYSQSLLSPQNKMIINQAMKENLKKRNQITENTHKSEVNILLNNQNKKHQLSQHCQTKEKKSPLFQFFQSIFGQNKQNKNGVQKARRNSKVFPLQSIDINPSSNWNFIKKLAKVKKFIEKIKTSNVQQSFYKIKNGQHVTLINDKSYFLNARDYISCKILEKMFKLLQKIPVLYPDQPFVLIFKGFVFLLTIFLLFLVPLKVSFLQNIYFNQLSLEHFMYFLIPLTTFIIETLISFNTAYYEEGNIQTSRKKIAKVYFKQHFIIDLLSILGIIINKEYALLLVMFRIIKIQTYRKEMDEQFQIEQLFPTFYTLVNLLILILFVGHIFACGFHFITLVQDNQDLQSGQERNWMTEINIYQQKWSIKYLNAAYFSFITMITVGFGDIKPISNYEKTYVIFMTLTSSFFFSYTVNTIGTVFQEIAQKQAEFKAEKYNISNYMRQRGINSKLQNRVFKYLDHINNKLSESPEKGQFILKKVSKKLREEVYKDFFGKILTNSKIFKFNFSDDVLNELTLHMKEALYGPGEILFSNGEIDNRIFYINKGQIEIFLEEKQQQNKYYSYDVLNKGDIFGQQSFFASKIRENNAKSITISHLTYLTQEDFIKVIKQFPKDYEKYCQIKDEILCYNEQMYVKCLMCQKFRHSIVDCPYLHLKLNKQNVVYRHIRNQPNDRSKYFRKRRTKMNYLTCNQKVRYCLKKIRKEYVQTGNQNKKQNDCNGNTYQLNNGYNININNIQSFDHNESLIEKQIQQRKKYKNEDKHFFRNHQAIYYDGKLKKMFTYSDFYEEEEDEDDDDEEEYEIMEEHSSIDENNVLCILSNDINNKNTVDQQEIQNEQVIKSDQASKIDFQSKNFHLKIQDIKQKQKSQKNTSLLDNLSLQTLSPTQSQKQQKKINKNTQVQQKNQRRDGYFKKFTLQNEPKGKEIEFVKKYTLPNNEHNNQNNGSIAGRRKSTKFGNLQILPMIQQIKDSPFDKLQQFGNNNESFNNKSKQRINFNENFLFYYDFDMIKEYINYFPHNNYTKVCIQKKMRYNRRNFFSRRNLGNSARNLGSSARNLIKSNVFFNNSLILNNSRIQKSPNNNQNNNKKLTNLGVFAQTVIKIQQNSLQSSFKSSKDQQKQNK